MSNNVTQEVIRELLHYNQETGVFTWKKREPKWFNDTKAQKSFNSNYAEKQAGSVVKNSNSKKDYLVIGVLKDNYLAHRLAWLYVYGEHPLWVDHIDGNGLNNAIKNLRNVSNLENSKNTRLRINSKTKICGVSWSKVSRKWRAYITESGKQLHLGLFENFDDAVSARELANIQYNFHENHGQDRPL